MEVVELVVSVLEIPVTPGLLIPVVGVEQVLDQMQRVELVDLGS